MSISLQFSLMATFPEHILGILLFCGCVMVIGIIQVRHWKCISSSPSGVKWSPWNQSVHPPKHQILSLKKVFTYLLLIFHLIPILCNHVIILYVVSPVGDRVVRLQPSLPAEWTDPDLREPDLLQTPHPQSHHAGSPHVLLRQHLLLHLLPAGRWHFFFLLSNCVKMLHLNISRLLEG